MTVRSWSMTCSACGTVVGDPAVFTCPSSHDGDDIDHVLVPDGTDAEWPTPPESGPSGDVLGGVNPFVHYRELLASYGSARSLGLSDSGYLDIVARLDEAIVGIDGAGFRITPVSPEPALSTAVGHGGPLFVKDETGNVSGSHKGRHLVGLMHHLLAIEATGGFDPRPRLAIASCGNAALAAAVVARAADWPLDVFVPPDAPPAVLERLESLRASVRICERQTGELGDPCFLRFTDATRDGSLPFGCQGTANGLTIDGGTTLGLEFADQLAMAEVAALDHVVLQVGGGAFASATMLGLRRAVERSIIGKLPRLHAVQTTGAAPLSRAAEIVRQTSEPSETLIAAARARSTTMWAWEDEPQSLASGILDDETYDWRTIVADLIDTSGTTPIVAEASLEAAYDAVASTTQISADHTGVSGVAGLLELCRDGVIGADERVGVIVSGARRS